MKTNISRRGFLRTSALTAGGVLLVTPGNFVAAADDKRKIKKTASYNPEMEYRRLGSTGLWVSAVCLGGHFKKIAEHTGHEIYAYFRPEDPKAAAALDKNRDVVITRCMEVGINYVDACTADEFLTYSKALKGRRDKFYLGYSSYPECPREEEYRTKESLLETLDKFMSQAKAEYIDIWRMTCNTEGEHTEAEEYELVAALEKAKEQGKIRFGGVSSHSRDWLKHMAESYPETIQVMCFPYTAKTKELPGDSLFEAVRRYDIGTFGIKPFGSNSLFDGAIDAEEKSRRARITLRFILNNPSITAPIPGLATTEEVDNAVVAIKERRELSRNEMHELDTMTDDMYANLTTEYKWLKNWDYV